MRRLGLSKSVAKRGVLVERHAVENDALFVVGVARHE
jgi:hypothetical protein